MLPVALTGTVDVLVAGRVLFQAQPGEQGGRAAVCNPAAANRMKERPKEFEMTEIPTRLSQENLRLLENIGVALTVEVGRTELTIRELLRLSEGSVVELNRMAGRPAGRLVNGTPIAKGEVVLVGDRFGIRFGQIITPEERVGAV